MATSQEQAVEGTGQRAYPVTEVQALQAWHLARQAARRHNRNLLQCAAGLAAVLGITAGGGGMLALAESLRIRSEEVAGIPADAAAQSAAAATLRETLSSPMFWLMAISALVGVILIVQMVAAYRGRQLAERQADANAVKLIAISPQWLRDLDE